MVVRQTNSIPDRIFPWSRGDFERRRHCCPYLLSLDRPDRFGYTTGSGAAVIFTYLRPEDSDAL